MNYYNRDNLCFKTLLGYAKAINTLFILCAFKPPVDINNENNMAGILINNLIEEENIATQRSPLNNAIFSQIQQAACISNNPDSDHSHLSNIGTLSCYIGPRVSKFSQTTQSKVDYHIYPSGRQVIKALRMISPFLMQQNANSILLTIPLLTRQTLNVLPGVSKRIDKMDKQSC